MDNIISVERCFCTADVSDSSPLISICREIKYLLPKDELTPDELVGVVIAHQGHDQ